VVISTPRGPVECAFLGEGPAVLVVHATFGGHDQGLALFGDLAGLGVTVISPSRPGYLGTPLASGPRFEDQAGLLACLLEELGVEGTVVVAASGGGPPAYLLAASRPDLVNGLVAVDCVSGPYRAPPAAGEIGRSLAFSRPGARAARLAIRRLPRPAMTVARLVQGGESPSRAWRMAGAAVGDPERPRALAALIDGCAPHAPRRRGSANDLDRGVGMAPLPLADVACPTLVVHGTADASVPFAHAVRAARQIPGAELVAVEGGVHMGLWVAAEAGEARRRVHGFVRAYARGRATAGGERIGSRRERAGQASGRTV
jgi:pimeloyl-ACP methyl ester carboxylesterase